MSDIHELMISVDLQDEISAQELAELSWHLGIGPQPERLSIITEFPVVVVDDSGIPVIEDDPYPLLAGQGVASRVGGVLCSTLASRTDLPRKGWSLTSRQEIHPDEFEKVGELLCWRHKGSRNAAAREWRGRGRTPQVLRSRGSRCTPGQERATQLASLKSLCGRGPGQ
ncbi:hypothetical protein ACIPUC_15075 [Streptomyces sp. LARHCF249]